MEWSTHWILPVWSQLAQVSLRTWSAILEQQRLNCTTLRQCLHWNRHNRLIAVTLGNFMVAGTIRSFRFFQIILGVQQVDHLQWMTVYFRFLLIRLSGVVSFFDPCFSIFLLVLFLPFSACLLFLLFCFSAFLRILFFSAVMRFCSSASLLPFFTGSLLFFFFCLILSCLYPNWNPRETQVHPKETLNETLHEALHETRKKLQRNPEWNPTWSPTWDPKETLKKTYIDETIKP